MLGHILLHCGTFPSCEGATLLDDAVTEADLLEHSREFTDANLVRTPPTQYLCVNDSTIVSLVQFGRYSSSPFTFMQSVQSITT